MVTDSEGKAVRQESPTSGRIVAQCLCPKAVIAAQRFEWQHVQMDELQAEADQVRSVLGRSATPERRKLLNRALSSKWEGTQAHAIKALAAWGDRDSIDTIRDFLISAFDRKHGWALRGVAIRALAPIIGPEDASWIGELCRSRSSGLERHELRHLIERVTTFPKK